PHAIDGIGLPFRAPLVVRGELQHRMLARRLVTYDDARDGIGNALARGGIDEAIARDRACAPLVLELGRSQHDSLHALAREFGRLGTRKPARRAIEALT